MIPLTLQLKNFMSYGEEPVEIDFTGMHTVCLSGENGHGKSAVLDAITWALWGETRLGKQNHEQLIRLGADEMSVDFTFEVGGEPYRVRRQRSKRTNGQNWELMQRDGGGNWRSRTGTSSTETARAIQNLLRMSYDTFLNSAYLRQGRADEFVRQPAGKRKEILCEILDLSRYDELEAAARLKTRAAGDAALDAERRVNLATATLAEEPALKEHLSICVTAIADATAASEQLNTQWETAREKHHEIRSRQQRGKQIDAEISRIDADEKQMRSEEASERAREKALVDLLAQRDAILAEYAALRQARSRLEALTADASKLSALERDRLSGQHEIDTERQSLTSMVDQARREGADVASRIDRLAKTNAELAKMLPRLEVLAAAETRRKALLEKDIPEARDTFSEIKHKRAVIDGKISEAVQRRENLERQQEVCSVCGSPLPPEKIAGLSAECAETISALEIERNSETKRLQECKSRLDHLKADLDALDKGSAEYDRLGKDAAAAERAVAELPALQARAMEIEERRKKVAARLDAQQFASAARAKLAEIAPQIAALGDVAAKLDACRAEVRRLEPAEKRRNDIEHAQTTIVEVRERIAAHHARLAEIDARRTTLAAERTTLGSVDAEIEAIEKLADELKTRRQSVTAEIQSRLQERGRLEEGLQRCDRARVEKAAFEKERTEARRLEEMYKQLAGAFGKQGVQALIIENAVPELEDDANAILERLTDGDMRIKIETRKEAKSKGGGDIETLEILISDNLGTRPLELYSGGEAFRVSFALRIALSNLLARRAGARLQTLIIDEGFGTQDAKGREKLVDAIHVIKDDFERIIVITHIDELKEAFPSRIDVFKTPLGSQIAVTHGGMIG
ncbi:MAG: SMC family ATPase [Capsulimonadaceae bacterium]|nr:SMC family ATPase [Capsulimonadaceae bacterium]